MITITSPQSIFTESTIHITWEDNSPVPQTGYEFIYKKVSDSAWSTLGIVESSDKWVDVPISKFQPLVEYYYRIVGYYKESNEADYTEFSTAYSILVHPKKLGELCVQVSSTEVQRIPLYSEANPELKSVAVATAEGVGHAVVVDDSSTIPLNRSNLHIQSDKEFTFTKASASFGYSNIPQGGSGWGAEYATEYGNHYAYEYSISYEPVYASESYQSGTGSRTIYRTESGYYKTGTRDVYSSGSGTKSGYYTKQSGWSPVYEWIHTPTYAYAVVSRYVATYGNYPYSYKYSYNYKSGTEDVYGPYSIDVYDHTDYYPIYSYRYYATGDTYAAYSTYQYAIPYSVDYKTGAYNSYQYGNISR